MSAQGRAAPRRALCVSLRVDPDPDLVDRDLMVYALKAGYGKTGAKIGSNSPGEADLFREDMLAFWRGTLDKAGAL